MDSVKVIAEIGCNHKGDLSTAKEMIEIAKEYCGVDIVKFQKRSNQDLLTEEEYNAPHPVASNSYGATYGEHRANLEFTITEHKELKEYCEELGVEYSCSVWDLVSAKGIVSLNPKRVKIPSACNLDGVMLRWLIDNYDGELHVSMGMTTKEEMKAIYSVFAKDGAIRQFVPYACTSGYPVDFEDVCLLELENMWYTDNIGFSGHHLGIAVDMAAVTLGATYIERHFTLDRTWKGTDHAASLEPDGMRRLVRDVRNVEKALHHKPKEILNVEQVQREKLKGCLL